MPQGAATVQKSSLSPKYITSVVNNSRSPYTNIYQEAITLGPYLTFRVNFHSITLDPGYMPVGEARGQNLLFLEVHIVQDISTKMSSKSLHGQNNMVQCMENH